MALKALNLSTENLNSLDSVVFTFTLFGANTVPAVLISCFVYLQMYTYIYNQLLLYSFPPSTWLMEVSTWRETKSLNFMPRTKMNHRR